LKRESAFSRQGGRASIEWGKGIWVRGPFRGGETPKDVCAQKRDCFFSTKEVFGPEKEYCAGDSQSDHKLAGGSKGRPLIGQVGVSLSSGNTLHHTNRSERAWPLIEVGNAGHNSAKGLGVKKLTIRNSYKSHLGEGLEHAGRGKIADI